MSKALVKLSLVVVLAGVFLPACSGVAPAVKPVEKKVWNLKATTPYIPTHILGKQLYILAEKAKKASDGQINIQVFPSGQLVSTSEEFAAVGAGTVDLCAGAGFTGPVPASAIFLIPYALTSVSQQNKIYDELTPTLDSILSRHNLKFLGGQTTLWFDWATKKPVRTVEDLKGMKIRTMGGFYNRAVTLWGGAPVSVPSAEQYLALQTGVADGTLTNTSSIGSFKLYEVVKYVTYSGVLGPGTWTLMNLDTWKSLPKNLQDIFVKASAETRAQVIAELESEYQDKAWNYFKQQGVEVYSMPKEEQARFKKLVTPLYDEYIEKLSPGDKPIGEQIRKVFQKYP